MKKVKFVCVYSIILLSLSLPSTANEIKSITDKAEIDKILSVIPVNDKKLDYKNLGERLPKLGLVVTSIVVGKLDPDEIKISKGRIKASDVLYDFVTNDPNEAVTQICPIVGMFTLIKRGNHWLADDRTSNFLLSGYVCSAP